MNVINNVNQDNYEPLVHKVLKRCYKHMKISKKRVLTVILVSNEEIKELNKQYRGKDYTTDVLTFPSEAVGELGDVIIALHKAFEQAHEYGHTKERELAFLVVHGFLHALGYDHETKEEEERMFTVQRAILDKLKIYR